MREWVDGTVERILALASLPPARVLEIGCGTGLLLFRIAPRAARYAGDRLLGRGHRVRRGAARGARRRGPALPRASLAQRRGRRLSRGSSRGSFDARHPQLGGRSTSPTSTTCSGCSPARCGRWRRAAPSSSATCAACPLLGAFAASVELHQAAASLPVAELAQRVRRRIQGEEELVLDPTFFTALAESIPEPLAGAEVRLKRGRAANELTRFRYDVVLRVRGESAAAPAKLASGEASPGRHPPSCA